MNLRRTVPWVARRLGSALGMTVAEVATILAALSILGAVMTPEIDEYVSMARMARATHDARTIAVAIVRLRHDVGGEARMPGGLASFDVLVSAGELPALTGAGDRRWLETSRDLVGLLDDQLVTNAPGYTRAREGGLILRGGWRGPYLEPPIGPDPWNHRFAINSRYLEIGRGFDTIVLSGGPDGRVETAFEDDGQAPGGDDVIALISSG